VEEEQFVWVCLSFCIGTPALGSLELPKMREQGEKEKRCMRPMEEEVVVGWEGWRMCR
jgi:hypothetical protein